MIELVIVVKRNLNFLITLFHRLADWFSVDTAVCGNKWTQFPVDEIINTRSISSPKKVVSRPQPVQAKIKKPKKIKKTDQKKRGK